MRLQTVPAISVVPEATIELGRLNVLSAHTKITTLITDNAYTYFIEDNAYCTYACCIPLEIRRY